METSDDNLGITLGVLNAVHGDSRVTQRRIASELGIALGLANAYLARCIRKGFIKIRHIPANRYAYYLTPAGFAEKSRLTVQYLSISFTFFRRARRECSAILETCERHDWRRLALLGASDLAEIVVLCTTERRVELIGLIDGSGRHEAFMGLPVVDRLDRLAQVDAVIVTDLANPQQAYGTLTGHLAEERIQAPDLLGIVRPADDARGRRP